jgi:hypothetical protein
MTLGLVVAVALSLTTRRTSDTPRDAPRRSSSTHAMASLKMSRSTATSSPDTRFAPEITTAKVPALTNHDHEIPKVLGSSMSLRVPQRSRDSDENTRHQVLHSNANGAMPSARSELSRASTSSLVPATVAPVAHLTTASYSARLSFPADVSTQYLFSTLGGELTATAQWTGPYELNLTLSCKGSARSTSSTLVASITLKAQPGECRVGIAEPPDVQASAAYTLNVSYMTSSTEFSP